jgi:hypothetical protein
MKLPNGVPAGRLEEFESLYAVRLPTFAIRVTPEAMSGNVVLAIFSDRGDYRVGQVASSFSDFVERYLASSDSRLGLIPSETGKSVFSSTLSDRSHPLWDRALDG